MKSQLDQMRDRFRAAIENNTDWIPYRIDICMNHLMQALTSSQGQFIVYSVGQITCGTWQSTNELFLHAEVLVKVGPDFESTRLGTFTFKTDGPKYQGLLTPKKPGPSESNVRDKKCKRTRTRREGRAFKRAVALIDVEDLFR